MLCLEPVPPGATAKRGHDVEICDGQAELTEQLIAGRLDLPCQPKDPPGHRQTAGVSLDAEVGEFSTDAIDDVLFDGYLQGLYLAY